MPVPFAVSVPEVEITSDPSSGLVIIGGTITLICSVTRGNPTSYTYEWSLWGSNDKITETSNTLTVSVTSVNQLGTYECIVDNSIGTGSGNITIVEGSKFLCTFVNIDLCMMMLHCNSSAFITVQVQGIQVQFVTDLRQIVSIHTLKLPVPFAVVPEVEITSDPSSGLIVIGGTITLTCSVTRGNPTSYTYKWSLWGSNDKITETSNTLTVSVTSVNQLGTYECIVDNGIGTGSGNITIVEGSKFLCTFVNIDLCMMMLHCNRRLYQQ